MVSLYSGGKSGGTTAARGVLAPIMLWPYDTDLLFKVTTSFKVAGK